MISGQDIRVLTDAVGHVGVQAEHIASLFATATSLLLEVRDLVYLVKNGQLVLGIPVSPFSPDQFTDTPESGTGEHR